MVATQTAAPGYYIEIQHVFNDIDGDARAFAECLRLVCYRDKKKHPKDDLSYAIGVSECDMHYPYNGLPREMVYEFAKKSGGRKMAMIKGVPMPTKRREEGWPNRVDIPAAKNEPHAHAMVSGRHASARAQRMVDYLHGRGFIAYKVPLKTTSDVANYSSYIKSQSTHYRTV